MRVVADTTDMEVPRVAKLARMVDRNDFKRFQYAQTLRVSTRCWGGRRVPVVHLFVDEG
ncbi:MAG: hypothetical protein H6832_05845 [Planctomycetes bacterium]|nr:hypothetical protein [Planctomycetota bacterium]MCB9917907.1 hypothetical protein [Planctomycetota bacterium]